MLMQLSDEQIDLINQFKESKLKRKEFCLLKNIKYHQLDYLIHKQKRLIHQEMEPSKLEIIKVEEVKEEYSPLTLRIGSCFIDIDNNFNEELLASVIKVISNVKF
jgi:hypothetical protein